MTTEAVPTYFAGVGSRSRTLLRIPHKAEGVETCCLFGRQRVAAVSLMLYPIAQGTVFCPSSWHPAVAKAFAKLDQFTEIFLP